MSVLRGLFLGLMAAAACAFALGFWSFAASVDRAAPPQPLPEADAIVALTGGGAKRLETGMRLLAEGRGRRLLVSGVNPVVSDADLMHLLKAPAPLFACCVDIGRYAEDTLGNASETAAWARRNGFDRVIVVTDDYHMPRSLAELRIALPEAQLIAYPVKTGAADPNRWQAGFNGASRLAAEYVKLLIIKGRESLMALDRPSAQPAPPTA